MTKEEIIINEQYVLAVENYEIPDIYLNVYNADYKNNSFESQLRIAFAFYQSELNRLFNFLNNRINGSKYYTANEGRLLLKYIENIIALQTACFKTQYEFFIDKAYYLYFKKIQSIIGEHGTKLPDELESVKIKKYEPIFNLKKSSVEFIRAEERIDEVLSLVSTRNARFDEMADDEKLENLNIAIEHMLKENQKYLDFDYDNAFIGYISKEDVVKFRKDTHCFRHAAEDIEKRNDYSVSQKRFLANYGLTICMAILNKKNEVK